MPNPYTLVFGAPPTEVVERTAQAESIISSFDQEVPANPINLVTGIRGSGKTVFITGIAERLQKKDNWIIVNLNAQRDMLQSLAAKLDSNRYLNRIFREAEINLQAFGIGVGIKGVPSITDIEEALILMLRRIEKEKKHVLITVDEVTNSKDMRIFASTFQIFLRERLPVCLLMTGLYKHIDQLRNADGMTFLERAPRTVLSPLRYDEMSRKYKETLLIRDDEANRLSALTKGYAFAFQTVGYYAFEFPDDSSLALEKSKEYLYEFAYRKIRSELSPTDRKVALAIARVPSGEISQIRKLLGYSTNEFNPYRNRLIKSGVILGPQPGFVEFALPWFGEYLQYAETFDII